MTKTRLRRYVRRLLLAGLLVLVALVVCWPHLVRMVGGSSSRQPDELAAGLGPAARALVDAAFADLGKAGAFDYHTHLVGLGSGGTGCFVNPDMRSWWHMTRRVQFDVYLSASGIEDHERADAQYVARLVDQIRHIPNHGRYALLALDKNYALDGRPNLEKTAFFTPNDYVFRIAREHPDCFVPVVSVHPYRDDAVAELERCANSGARIVKWIPNSMGIDPSHDRCVPFYAAMKARGLVLLTHAGEEQAVHSEDDQRFGNPLLLRRPLGMGVTVIIAHCASLGSSADLDDAARPQVDNYSLFLRLMDEPAFEGRLFGEISATTQLNRQPGPLRGLLERTDLHARLVNGSDYPLPAINVLISTRALVGNGLLTEDERGLLNEIFEFNPLLFDFVLKRTLRGEGGTRFAASVFVEHPAIAASR